MRERRAEVKKGVYAFHEVPKIQLLPISYGLPSLVAQTCSAGDPGLIPGSERFPGEGNSTHSNILAWRILWREEPGRLQSMGLPRVRRDWAFNTFTLWESPEAREERQLKTYFKLTSRVESILTHAEPFRITNTPAITLWGLSIYRKQKVGEDLAWKISFSFFNSTECDVGSWKNFELWPQKEPSGECRCPAQRIPNQSMHLGGFKAFFVMFLHDF